MYKMLFSNIKTILVILALGLSVPSMAQTSVTDYDIATALLGKKTYEVNQTLKDLGVWYHFHFQEKRVDKGEEKYPKIYSIADSDGHAKVYILRNTLDQVVYEVMINFRHDDMAQVTDLENVHPPDEFNVGTYSTDIVYRLKN